MRRSPLLAFAVGLASLVALAVACGTGAPAAGDGQNLPNALAGPFRVLRKPSEGPSAPFVISSTKSLRDPSALDLDGDPGTLGVALYVENGSDGFPHSIFRFELPDGPEKPATSSGGVMALAGSEEWEKENGKPTTHKPFVLRVGAEIWLYYEAAGCIGRATSPDGVTFTKSPATAPVLCADASTWEGASLGAPSVHQARDGSFRLLYGANGQIGEARSPDGITFTRVSTSPVLAPRAPLGPLAPDAGADDPFDDESVDDPHAMIATTGDGRPLTYVYYTGRNRLGEHVIGLAARFGDDGPLDPNPTPVLSRYDAHGPTVVRHGPLTMLYTGGRSSEASMTWTPSVLGAVAPATSGLPPIPAVPEAGAGEAGPLKWKFDRIRKWAIGLQAAGSSQREGGVSGPFLTEACSP